MKTLYTNIRGLLAGQSTNSLLFGHQLAEANILHSAYLLIENDRIIDIGSMKNTLPKSDNQVDLSGKWIIPAFCDSHTHLVFAKTRENEFEQRIVGASYEEIAQAGAAFKTLLGYTSK